MDYILNYLAGRGLFNINNYIIENVLGNVQCVNKFTNTIQFGYNITKDFEFYVVSNGKYSFVFRCKTWEEFKKRVIHDKEFITKIRGLING